ncbi:MAG: hypothetical protein V4576_02425 [Patescibacteria group bacterium]
MNFKNLLTLLISMVSPFGAVREICDKSHSSSRMLDSQGNYIGAIVAYCTYWFITMWVMLSSGIGAYTIFINNQFNAENDVFAAWVAVIWTCLIVLFSAGFGFTKLIAPWCKKHYFAFFDHIVVVIRAIDLESCSFLRKLWRFNKLSHIEISARLRDAVALKVAGALAVDKDPVHAKAKAEHQEKAKERFTAGKELLLLTEADISVFYREEKVENERYNQ